MSRPWISCNLALSADGKISSASHRPADWTSKKDHRRLLQLRVQAQALIVGRGTWQTDRMTMTAPDAALPPLRCVVSRSGQFDRMHPMFQRPGGAIHLLVTGDAPCPPVDGAHIHHMPLSEFLTQLHQDQGVSHLHCEGGGELMHSLAELDAIDELHLTLAGHTLIGGADSPTVTGIPGDFLPCSLAFEIRHFEADPTTGECFLSYRRLRHQ